MLDQSPSLLEINTPTLNHSPQDPDANNNDIVQVPFHVDRADCTHLQTNADNVQNETHAAANTITETNNDNEENTTHDRNDAYEAEIYIEETDNSNSRSRKRKLNLDQWKRNVTKRLQQSGQEYKDKKGNLKRARELKVTGDCGGTCKYRCSQK